MAPATIAIAIRAQRLGRGPRPRWRACRRIAASASTGPPPAGSRPCIGCLAEQTGQHAATRHVDANGADRRARPVVEDRREQELADALAARLQLQLEASGIGALDAVES